MFWLDFLCSAASLFTVCSRVMARGLREAWWRQWGCVPWCVVWPAVCHPRSSVYKSSSCNGTVKSKVEGQYMSVLQVNIYEKKHKITVKLLIWKEDAWCHKMKQNWTKKRDKIDILKIKHYFLMFIFLYLFNEKHKMWITPPLKIVLNQSTVSSCLFVGMETLLFISWGRTSWEPQTGSRNAPRQTFFKMMHGTSRYGMGVMGGRGYSFSSRSSSRNFPARPLNAGWKRP